MCRSRLGIAVTVTAAVAMACSAARPSPRPEPVASAPMVAAPVIPLPAEPAIVREAEEASLDALLGVTVLKQAPGPQPAYRSATARVEVWRETHDAPGFCTGPEGEYAVWTTPLGTKEAWLVRLPVTFGGPSAPAMATPCQSEQFATPPMGPGRWRFEKLRTGFDASGRQRSTSEPLPFEVPEEAKDAEYLQLYELGGQRVMAYWTRGHRLLALRLFDGSSQRWSAVPTPKGSLSVFESRRSFSLASSVVDSECRGVFEFTKGAFTCAPLATRSQAYQLFRGVPGWAPLSGPVFVDAWWDLELPRGWALRTVLPRGRPEAWSELVAPTKERYRLLSDSEAVCTFEREVQTAGRHFLVFTCRDQLQRNRTVWWDSSERRPWLPREDELHRATTQTGRPFVVTGTEVRRWRTRSPTGDEVLLSLEDKPFVAPRLTESGALEPLRFALLTKNGVAEVVRVERPGQTFRVVLSIGPRDCPGVVGWGYRAIVRGERFVLHCASPIAGQRAGSGEGQHQWSELIDVEAGWRWRTKHFIRELGADGTVFMTDTNRHTRDDNDHRAVLHGRPAP